MPIHFRTRNSPCCRRWPPIDQRLRQQFLQEVTAALEAEALETGVSPGVGVVHRVGRVVQRRFWNPPQLSEDG